MGSRDVMKLLELLNTLDKEVIEATYKNSLILKMKQLKEDIDLDKKKEAIANFVIEMFPLISFTFNDEEIKQLDDVIGNKKIKKVSHRLLHSCYVFNVSGKYIVPDEIKEIYNVIKDDKAIDEKNLAVISFYLEVNGIIDIDTLQYLIEKSGLKMTKTKLINYLKDIDCIIDGELIFLSEVSEDKLMYELKKDEEYKIFSLEEIIACNIALKSFNEELQEILNNYVDDASYLSETIIHVIIMGFNYDENVQEIMNCMHIKLKKKDKQQFDNIIDDIYNQMPSWEYNGFSPDEIFDEDYDEEDLALNYINN